jgi:hypothetical protein
MVTKIDFIKSDPTKTGKERWNVKIGEGWYSVWSSSVAAQLTDANTNGYEIDVTIEPAKDPKYNDNITAVKMPGVVETEEDILAAFKDEPAKPAPTPASPGMTKPAVSELQLLIEERKFAIHMATLAFAGDKIDKDGISKYADYVLGYVQNNPQIEHKISSPKKEIADGLSPNDFVKR